MDASGLFTVLGIFVAIIALMSEERRRDFFLRSTLFFWGCFFILNIFVLLVLYSNVIINVFDLKPIVFLWGFDEETIILSCSIVMSLMFIFKLTGRYLPVSKYKKWEIDSERLLIEKKYAVLGFLLERYIDDFLKVLSHKKLYYRFKLYLTYKSLELDIWGDYDSIKLNLFNFNYYKYKFKFYFFKIVIKNLPDPNIVYKSDIVHDSIHKVLISKDFVGYLIIVNKVIPIKLTAGRYFLYLDEFTDNLFRMLISSKDSPLYRELKDNDFYFSQENKVREEYFILHYFFNNAEKAVEAMIWQPLGNYICKFINELNKDEDFYNSYSDFYVDSDEKWECPIFVGIQFFDVMVKCSIYQELDEHMWLMYYKKFLDKILEKIDRSKNSDVSQEFPLKFDYLIFRIISNCCDWVSASNDIYNDVIQSLAPVEFASECLGQMIRKLVLSDKLFEHQKISYLEKTLKLMTDLDSSGNERLSKKIFNSIVDVDMLSSADTDLSWLRDKYHNVDHVLRSSKSTFAKELAKY